MATNDVGFFAVRYQYASRTSILMHLDRAHQVMMVVLAAVVAHYYFHIRWPWQLVHPLYAMAIDQISEWQQPVTTNHLHEIEK